MTDRELEETIMDYCGIVGKWNIDDISTGMVPYSNPKDFNDTSIEVIRRSYDSYIESFGKIPSYSDLANAVHDDYSNCQYAIASLEVAEEVDCQSLTIADFNEIIEEKVLMNFESDSYGNFLNYDEMVSYYYGGVKNDIGVMRLTKDMTDEITDFIVYSGRMANGNEVADKVEWLYDNGVVNDIVVGDCQQILIPDLICDNGFRNSYGELCIVADSKIEELRSA